MIDHVPKVAGGATPRRTASSQLFNDAGGGDRINLLELIRRRSALGRSPTATFGRVRRGLLSMSVVVIEIVFSNVVDDAVRRGVAPTATFGMYRSTNSDFPLSLSLPSPFLLPSFSLLFSLPSPFQKNAGRSTQGRSAGICRDHREGYVAAVSVRITRPL